MGKRFKRTICRLMALFMIIAFCPISPKAAGGAETGEPVLVNSIDELISVLNDPDGGDVIKLNSSPSPYIVTSTITITRDVTIDINVNIIKISEDSNSLETIFDINNATVTFTDSCGNGNVDASKLTGMNNSVNTYSYRNIMNVHDGGHVIISGKENWIGKIVADSTSNIEIQNGTFKEIGLSSLTSTNLTINNGKFYENPSDYIADTSTIVEYTEQTSFYPPSSVTVYEVRSTIMSEEFKKILTDGKLIVNAIKPESEDESLALFECLFDKYRDEDTNTYFYATCINLEEGLYDIKYVRDTYSEVHRLNVSFSSNIDPKIKDFAEKCVDKIPYDNYWGSPLVHVSDMEVINMLYAGFDEDDPACIAGIANYSGELKKILENKNMKLFYPAAARGDDNTFYSFGGGPATLNANDTVYYTFECFSTIAEHVIYVSADTGNDPDSLIAAAKKRIDEYLGPNNNVEITFAGDYSSYPEAFPGEKDDIRNSLNFATDPDYYFTFKIGSKNYSFFIIPDSNKMITPTYKTVDINSNVSISTTSSEVPLDASIQANKLSNGNSQYDKIIKKLNVENNITYDLKLYSNATSQSISKIEKDKFTVSVPIIDDTLKTEILSAYYVDDAGNIEEHPVTIEDGNAVFLTNHFSIYTIAKSSTKDTQKVCSVNGDSHKLTAVPEKKATVKSEGNKAYWKCDCGKWFSDADGKNEITDKSSVIIPKLKSPATGDTNKINLFFVLFVLSGIALIIRRKIVKNH